MQTMQEASRLNLSDMDYFTVAKRHLKGKWCYTAICSLFYLVPYILIQFLLPDHLIVISFIILSPFSIGFSRFYLNIATGSDVSYHDVFFCFQSFRIYFKAIGLSLAVFLSVIFGFLLCYVPGIFASIWLSQSYFIFIEDPNLSIKQIFKKSYAIMKDKKKQFVCLYCTVVCWGILSIFTLYIGLLWLLPYTSTALTVFYIRNKAKYQNMQQGSEQIQMEPTIEQNNQQ